MSRPAIVTTLRNADPVIDFFIDYHLAVGFWHLILFFDDPEDVSLSRVAQRPEVTAIPNDDALKLEWRETMRYEEVRDTLYGHTYSVPSKQILNCEIAIEIALKAGFDWLLHIDVDEIFYCSTMRVDRYFDKLTSSGIENVIFYNNEGIPESFDIQNYFTDVTLFKRNPHFFPPEEYARLEKQIINPSPLFSYGYYIKYLMGKSAARVTQSLYPMSRGKGGCHRFIHVDKLDAEPHESSEETFLLHFPLCGYDHFVNMYAMRGPEFRRKRDFSRDAHRIIMNGDRAESEAFYRKYIMCDDPAEVGRLLECGLLRRIEDIPARARREMTSLPV